MNSRASITVNRVVTPDNAAGGTPTECRGSEVADSAGYLTSIAPGEMLVPG
jgi:hypothetical protein